MKYTLFILYTLCLSFNFNAQDATFLISGKVIDAETKQTLSNVSVQIVNDKTGFLTDSLGHFSFNYSTTKVEIKLVRVGYESKIIKINFDKNKDVTIELKQKNNALNEVTVSGSSVEIVLQSKKSNVLTYGFINDNIVLITYRNNLAKSKLVLLNQNFDTLSVINIPEEPSGLFKDCFGNNHIVCETKTYQIYTDKNQLKLLFPTNIKDFQTILAPCIASDSANLYFEQRFGSKLIPESYHDFEIVTNNHNVTYFYINKASKIRTLLETVNDIETIKRSNDEDRFEKIRAKGGPTIKMFRERAFAEYILFREIAAPLYKIKNTIYIFDYANGHIVSYQLGKQINSVDINFHKTMKWKREMIVDETTERAFAHFVIDGISQLHEISLNTGKLKNVTKIPYLFVKNIRAKNNYFYFLYKGKEYDDTWYLSRIKI